MSEHTQRPGEGKLPLPRPRSPRHLDDKILAYARDKAPEKRAFPQARWAAGLATAGVVVLALFITQSQQQAPDFSTPAPVLEEDSLPGAARTESVKAKPKAPAASSKMSRATGQAVRREKYERLADEPLPEQAITAGAMNAAAMADEDMAIISALPLAQTATAKELANVTDEELREKLQLYVQLVEQGEGEQARAAYQQLRAACPTCFLPDTLAQAIVMLLEAEPAPIVHPEPQ